MGNIIKYVLRAPHKGDYAGDLEKAKWYLNRLIKEGVSEACNLNTANSAENVPSSPHPVISVTGPSAPPDPQKLLSLSLEETPDQLRSEMVVPSSDAQGESSMTCYKQLVSDEKPVT